MSFLKSAKKLKAAALAIVCINVQVSCSNVQSYFFSSYTAAGYSETDGGIIQISEGLRSQASSNNDFLTIDMLDDVRLDEVRTVKLPAGKHRLRVTHARKQECHYVPWGGQYGGSSCTYNYRSKDVDVQVSPGGLYEIRLDPVTYTVIVTNGVCKDYECIKRSTQ